jgi:hypothetical protein
MPKDQQTSFLQCKRRSGLSFSLSAVLCQYFADSELTCREAWRKRFQGKGKPGIGRNPPVAEAADDPSSEGGGEFLSGAALADLRARCRMLTLSLDAAVAEER